MTYKFDTNFNNLMQQYGTNGWDGRPAINNGSSMNFGGMMPDLSGATPQQSVSPYQFDMSAMDFGSPDLNASFGGNLWADSQKDWMSGLGKTDPTKLNFGQKAGLGLMGLQTIGGLWGAYQSNKLAKEQLAYTKDVGNANLNNSIKSYNTSLETKARNHAAYMGQSDEEKNAYIDEHKLSR